MVLQCFGACRKFLCYGSRHVKAPSFSVISVAMEGELHCSKESEPLGSVPSRRLASAAMAMTEI